MGCRIDKGFVFCQVAVMKSDSGSHECSVEEPSRSRRHKMHLDRHRASALPRKCDLLWIATERLDIISHPSEGHLLILKADICPSFSRIKTKNTHAVIECHVHDRCRWVCD